MSAAAAEPGGTLALVVAMDEADIIGRGAALPWHLPDDLKHFKALTLGKPLIMGRSTYASIGRPLPGRRNIVLSRGDFCAEGVEVARSLEQAWRLAAAGLPASAGAEICVIGGAQIYALALPHARRIHLTRVHARVDGDVRFPAHALDGWREVDCRLHPADARHAYAMSFVTLERG